MKGMKNKCSRCGKRRDLTKHSLTGHHKPPFVYVCRICHSRIHDCLPRMRKKYRGYSPFLASS